MLSPCRWPPRNAIRLTDTRSSGTRTCSTNSRTTGCCRSGISATKGTHLVNLVDTNYVQSLGPGNINQRRRYKSIFVPLSVPGQAGPVYRSHDFATWAASCGQENTGNTIFHSMQAKVEHRFSSGFTILASWIWSKGLGDIRGSSPEGAAPGSAFQNPANLRQERRSRWIPSSHTRSC